MASIAAAAAANDVVVIVPIVQVFYATGSYSTVHSAHGPVSMATLREQSKKSELLESIRQQAIAKATETGLHVKVTLEIVPLHPVQSTPKR